MENDTVSSDEDEDGSNGPEETPAEELQPEEPETEKTAETEPAPVSYTHLDSGYEYGRAVLEQRMGEMSDP